MSVAELIAVLLPHLALPHPDAITASGRTVRVQRPPNLENQMPGVAPAADTTIRRTTSSAASSTNSEPAA
jgi:hypothetical protein